MSLTIIGVDAGTLPELVLWVPGKPQTAGSKSAVPVMKDGKPVLGPKGRPIVNQIESGTNDSRAAKKTYRGDLRDAAARAIDAVDDPRAEDGLARLWPTDRALEVVFVFVMRRPGAHLRTGRSAGEVKPWALRVRPAVRPDAVKLARAAEDALTGVVWVDDSQIVDERLHKVYADQAGPLSVQSEGVLVSVREARRYSGPLVSPAWAG
jgi:hypothetical protein